MYLFLLVAMVAHIRREIRVYVIIPWCYLFWTYYRNFDTPLFLSGYFLAELHANLETVPLLPVSPFPTFKLKSHRSVLIKTMHTIAWSIVAFLGLWLLSFPTADGANTFGYVTLCNILHQYSYFQKRVAWQSFGASILCLALLYLPRAQRWLSLPLFQYLGRISFSLYLMHGLVIRTMGHRLILEGWNHFNEDAHTERMFLNVMVFVFAILPSTIWLSDIFWRGVEAPATNFVRYLEGLVLAKEEEAQMPFKRS
jgi:peptidoglycan/LPS O-acetylase OafA/YrhL